MPVNEIEVTIGTVQLNQSLSAGSNFYLLRNTPELLSTLSTRKTDKEKQGGHGTEDSLSFYGPRILRFEGEVHASSQAARITLEQALKTVLALRAAQSYDDEDGYVLVEVTDEDGEAKQIYAKVLEPPVFSLLDDAMPESRRFEFVLYAKDPILYGQTLEDEVGPESFLTTTLTFEDGDLPTVKDGDLPVIQDDTANEMTVVNDGSYDTPPVIIVEGPTTDPVIMNVTTGRKMAFTAGGGLELLADETLTINVAALSIIKTDSGDNNTDVSGMISTDSEWIFLAPGSNILTLFDETSDDLSGQITVQFRPAWL